MKNLTLEGRWVRLEPLGWQHLEGLLQLALLEDYPFTTVPRTQEGMRAYIAGALESVTVPFATVERSSGRLAGSTRFANFEYWPWPGQSPLPQHPDAVEIGWTWLAPFAQRTAINTEAKYLQLTHAFEVWGVRRLTLKTDSRNQRSRNAIERLGAQLDGVLRAHLPASDGVNVRNSAVFSILASEWPEIKTRLQSRLGL